MENNTDSDPVSEDGWVCSVDVGPDRHWKEYFNRALQERYFLKQASIYVRDLNTPLTVSSSIAYDSSTTSTGQRRVLHLSR